MGRALVLGGGGIAGIAWEAGLIDGFRRAGTDLGDADLIVGTSAGAAVGAFLAHGADFAALLEDVAADPRETGAADLDPALVMAIFEALTDASANGVEGRRRAGVLALEADTSTSDERLDAVAEHLPSPEWPATPLLLTAVDVETGAFTVWRAGGAATLEQAVRSSCALPGVFHPVEIAGRRYMDGGVYSAASADLAQGHDRVVVLEPMAHLTRRDVLARELATLGSARIATVGPDAETAELFGIDLLSPKLWTTAYATGLRQAAAHAAEIADVWTA
ncbi:hypothetical protein BTM25_09210 [Actinomadura rubteroloni]|uniref:PNPLA domain-containing protein n=1 Tax=Actinomadura rubteroloni TaxID=1926885 RepID=A0A2P4UN93_9ACTN|nr:patatin-like phospholipase family protein [Actinomadura rubteroloni]POM26520.1 hypothetical protein BTM25_09210 [Actinomadura rubteroloni]